MTETQRIAEQLRRMYEGPAWHGPALLEALAGVTADQAGERPIAGAHTVHELVAHLAAWLPPWEVSLGELDAAERDLERAVLSFPADRLEEAAPASEPQTFYVLLHGVVQHGAYHAGQIALLKKRETFWLK